MKKALFTLIAAAFLPAVSLAATLSVPGDYSTIQRAVSAASNGDTIRVAPGTYRGGIETDKRLTIEGEGVTIDGSGIRFVLLVTDDGDLTLRDLTIDGGRKGARAVDESTMRLEGVTIRDGGDCVHINDQSLGIVSKGSLIEDCGDDGIDINDRAGLIATDSTVRRSGNDNIEIRMESLDGRDALPLRLDGMTLEQAEDTGLQLIDEASGKSERLITVTRTLIRDNGSAAIGVTVRGSSRQELRPVSGWGHTLDVIHSELRNNAAAIVGGPDTSVVNTIMSGNARGLIGVDGAVSHNAYDGDADVASSGQDVAPVIGLSGLVDAGTALAISPNGRTVIDLSPLEYSGDAPDIGISIAAKEPEPEPEPEPQPDPEPEPPTGETRTLRLTVAEDGEQKPNGRMDLTDEDLDMDNRVIAMRFVGVDVPRGARVASAIFSVRADEDDDVPTTLTITSDAADDAESIKNRRGYIVAIPRGAVLFDWQVPTWKRSTRNADTEVDIATIIQEIVDRSGWAPGNALTLVLSSDGNRVADSIEAGHPATLTIEYGEDG